MLWWKSDKKKSASTNSGAADISHQGVRIDAQGQVFLHSDTGEVQLKLKEVSGSQLIYEPFEIGSGDFVRGLLSAKETLQNGKLPVAYFALDLSNRGIPVHYITDHYTSAHGPSFSPEAKKWLIAAHHPDVQYNMETTWSEGMDWGQNNITLLGVSENARSRSGGRITFDPQGAWRKSGVLHVPLNGIDTMFMEAATARGIQIPKQNYFYTSGDEYAADVAAAAMYDDNGAKHRPLLLMNEKTGQVKLAVEDAQGKILQQSKNAIATANHELVAYLVPQCADKRPNLTQYVASPPQLSSNAVENVPEPKTESKSNPLALAALVVGGMTAAAGLYQHEKDKKKAEKEAPQEAKRTPFSGGTVLTTLGVLAMGWAVYSLLKSPTVRQTLH